MKLLITALAFLVTSPLLAQQQYGALTYAGGAWSPALSSGTALPTSLTPQTIALFCYNSGLGKWVAADSSCFGGGGSGTVSGQAVNGIGKATGATAITAQSALSDDGANVHSTEPLIVDGAVTYNANAPGGTQPFKILNNPLNGATYVPAATVYAVNDNTPTAFDISPHGVPTDLGYGAAWNDICTTDQIQFGSSAGSCLHMEAGLTPSGIFIGSAKYNSGTVLPFNLGLFDGDSPAFYTAIRIEGSDPSTPHLEIAVPMTAVGTQSISGCSLTGAVGGQWAGSFNSGVTGTCTVSIAPILAGQHAPNGFSCWASDLTTPADKLQQTGTLNTSTVDISGTTVSGDLITWGCVAF